MVKHKQDGLSSVHYDVQEPSLRIPFNADGGLNQSDKENRPDTTTPEKGMFRFKCNHCESKFWKKPLRTQRNSIQHKCIGGSVITRT